MITRSHIFSFPINFDDSKSNPFMPWKKCGWEHHLLLSGETFRDGSAVSKRVRHRMDVNLITHVVC